MQVDSTDKIRGANSTVGMNSEHMLTCSHEDYANLHGTMCLILVFFTDVADVCIYNSRSCKKLYTVSHLSSSWLDNVYFVKHYLSRDDATCLFDIFIFSWYWPI